PLGPGLERPADQAPEGHLLLEREPAVPVLPERPTGRARGRRASSRPERPPPRLRAAEGVIRHDPRQADHRCPAGRGMNLEVLHEDNHCLAVNKPAGLPSQGDASGAETLVDQARRYLKEKYGKPGNVYVGLVHRLDRPTSGVVLLARTSKAAGRLAARFPAGALEKVYLAIGGGAPSEAGGFWIDRGAEGRCSHQIRVVAGAGGGGQ